jgi:hypothetical protein
MGALPTLLKIASKPDLHRRILRCEHLPFGHVPDLGADHPVLDWSICPLDLFSHPLIAALLRLDRMAAISPLSGWPNDYAPWAVDGMMVLKTRRGE